jgi:hypothetical protein
MASVPSDDVNAEVDKAAALLSWLAKVTNDPGIESRVALGTTRYGRGLVALRNLVPNEVIFNVPWRLVLAEDHDEADASDLPWSALMAARLLEERHAGGERARWIESLPALVSTPPLEYTEHELAACEDAKAIAEATSTRDAHLAAYETLKPRLDAVECTERDLRWATGALHSRCFTHGPRGTHLAVPGVDLCNHDFAGANAAVAVVTSPEDVQGVAATAEIADVGDGDTDGGTNGDEIFFQLRAGEDGVEQGDEVTISYGPWPNDPFFLYFGFVPEGNPNDAVVLFDEVGDVAACAARLDMMSIAEAGERAAAAAAAWDEEKRNGGSGAPTRMVITREGIDEGVMRAVTALGLDGTGAFNALLEGRCKELLREYPTKLKEDRGLLNSGTLNENEFTSTLYKMSKKEVLLGPLAAAAARQREAGGTIMQV